MTRRGEALALFNDRRVQTVAFSGVEIAMAIMREEQGQNAASTNTVAQPLRIAAGVRDDAVQAGHLAGAELWRYLTIGDESGIRPHQKLRRGRRAFEWNVELVERGSPEALGLNRIVGLAKLAGECRERRRLVAFEQTGRCDVGQMIAGNESELDFRDSFSECDRHSVQMPDRKSYTIGRLTGESPVPVFFQERSGRRSGPGQGSAVGGREPSCTSRQIRTLWLSLSSRDPTT